MEHRPDTEQTPLSVYFCGKEDCEPGHSFGPAVRPHYLLHIVLDGKGIYQKSGHTYQLTKGDAFLIPPMESTFYQADALTPWKYAWVGFDGRICKEILKKTVFSDSYVFQSTSPETETALFASMKNLLSSFEETRGNQLQTVGNLLLLFSCMQSTPDKKRETLPHQYFQKAQEYIDNNYSYDIKISDIARHVGIDRTYLYKIFMEQEQISPKQYLLRHRIRVAAQMLCASSYTITEIAFSCGFKDTPAFCNYFKKQLGLTPRLFRKSFKTDSPQT